MRRSRPPEPCHGRDAFRVPQSVESSRRTPHRQEHLGRRRAVRADDPPLRQADFRPRRDRGRGRRLSGPRGRRLEPAVLQSAALRPSRISRRRGSAEAVDRRARCPAITRRCCAARSRRSSPIATSTSPTGRTRGMVPLAVGAFDLDDYIDYLRQMLDHLGPGVHTIGVCQPSVPLLAAAALMEADGDPNAPASMTLMGGPVDTRRSPTEVNKLAEKRGVEWFRRNVPAHRAVSLSGLWPGGLSGLSAALRLHGDEPRPPCQRSFRHVQPSGLGRRGFGREAPRLLRRVSGGDGPRRRLSTCRRSKRCSCATPCRRAR